MIDIKSAHLFGFNDLNKVRLMNGDLHGMISQWQTTLARCQIALDEETMQAIVEGPKSFQEIVARLDALCGLSDSTDFGDFGSRRQRFQLDVAQLRQRIKEARRGLLNPRSQYIQTWDLVAAMALLYTAFVTPFEVGLGLPTVVDSLFVVNQVINLVFIIDVFVQFVLPTMK